MLLKLVACLLLAIPAVAADKPNIVFILADDLGINDLACYGRGEHHTPNLDRLAQQGARFTQSYCALSICSPSRASLLTGKNPARLHLTTYLPGRADCAAQMLLHPKIHQHLPLEEVTLAERLKTAGYATALFGKWHLGDKGFLPTDQGFDVYYPGQANTKPSADEGGKGEQDLTTHAIDFIRSNTNRPFLLYLPHNAPHIPYTARTNLIAANRAALEPVYAAVIEELDNSVGRIMSALDELHLAEKTILIFTSDNGGLQVPEGPHKIITHNTPFRAGKGYLYEGGLRVPLIVRWPSKIKSGTTIDTPVINTDWTPTLCRIAGVECPLLDGADNRAILFSNGATTARTFFWHFPHYTNQGSQPAGAVRVGDWKLIEFYEDGRLELYNLAKDIGETNNLATHEPARAAALQKALADWRISIDAQTNARNPNFRSELHRQLYVDVVPSRFNASKATPDQLAEIQEWRKRMDAALRER